MVLIRALGAPCARTKALAVTKLSDVAELASGIICPRLELPYLTLDASSCIVAATRCVLESRPARVVALLARALEPPVLADAAAPALLALALETPVLADAAAPALLALALVTPVLADAASLPLRL